MNRVRFKEKQLIAQESARILIEEGIEDFQLAKQKAAKRLGYSPAHPLPGNDEIELAVSEYHRLFRGGVQGSHIRNLRIAALKAMTFLQHFSPRLVGNVADGSAGRHSPVVIYLLSDNPEPVLITFLNAGIPIVESSQRRLKAARKVFYPRFEFMLDDFRIEAHILPEVHFREYFQSRKSSAPYATIAAIKALLDKDRPVNK